MKRPRTILGLRPDRLRLAAVWLAAGVAVQGLTGCAALHRVALRRTEVFYRAETVEKLPEKPPDFPVRVLNTRPRSSRMLGTFAFTTDRSAEFAMESAQHNARKCGADAVWVRSLRQWAEPYTQYVPAQTNFVPSTQWISGPVWRPGVGGGRWQREGSFVQTFGVYYSSPYMVSGWSRFTAIDAVMLQLGPPSPTSPR
jgi:hypothetical protein